MIQPYEELAGQSSPHAMLCYHFTEVSIISLLMLSSGEAATTDSGRNPLPAC